MRPPIPFVVGTLMASFVAQPMAIAQIYYSPTVYRAISGRLVHFGTTNQGNSLALDPQSIRATRNGKRFVYYLSGSRITGMTTCQQGYSWYASGRLIPATSPAAKRLVDYICNSPLN